MYVCIVKDIVGVVGFLRCYFCAIFSFPGLDFLRACFCSGVFVFIVGVLIVLILPSDVRTGPLFIGWCFWLMGRFSGRSP